MIAYTHCDEKTLQSFALDQLGREQIEVARHIESCLECQKRLEAISCADLTWNSLGEILRDRDRLDFVNCAPVSGVSSNVRSRPLPFLAPTKHPESLGQFARYEIMELLGQGGMGIVMRGFDPALERHCAIKVLAPELATSGASRSRFSREAKSAAAVVHPHVVPIQNVDEHDGMPYLVMPVVEGQSLQQRVEDGGPLGTIEVIRISSQIAAGLAAAHGQGLVHRDIKPANILLENGMERVQITDFGLARAMDDASMTRSGVIAGTPQYMSPEQAHGDAIDSRSDLFSLGSVMYYMLTGHSPFRADTTMGVLNRICNDEPKPVCEINSDVPAWLAEFVAKLLSKPCEVRFQTSEQVAGLLEGCLAHLQQPNTYALPSQLNELTSKGRFKLFGHSLSDGRISPREQVEGKWTNSHPCPPNSVRRWLVRTTVAVMIIVSGILVALELNKSTLTIQCSADNIPVVISKNGEVQDRLTVGRGATSIRLFAGRYEVRVGSGNNEFAVEQDSIELKQGESTILRVREISSSASTDVSGLPEEKQADDMPRITGANHPLVSAGKATLTTPGRLDGAHTEDTIAAEVAHRKDLPLEKRSGRVNVSLEDRVSGNLDTIYSDNVRRRQFGLEHVNVHSIQTPEEFRIRLRDEESVEVIAVWGSAVADTLTVIAKIDDEAAIRRVLARMEADAATTPTLESKREHLHDERNELLNDIATLELRLIEVKLIGGKDARRASEIEEELQLELVILHNRLKTIDAKIQALRLRIADSDSERLDRIESQIENREKVQFKLQTPRGAEVMPASDDREPGSVNRITLAAPSTHVFTVRKSNGKRVVWASCTVELSPLDASSREFVRFNAIPLTITEDDFDHCDNHSYVLKAIYLRYDGDESSKSAGIHTLASTQIEAGVSPVAEARRRGQLIAVVRIQNGLHLQDAAGGDMAHAGEE